MRFPGPIRSKRDGIEPESTLNRTSGPEIFSDAQTPSPHFSVCRERHRFLVGAKPTRQELLQPVAIGAVMEATKLLKPLV